MFLGASDWIQEAEGRDKVRFRRSIWLLNAFTQAFTSLSLKLPRAWG